MRTSTLSFYCLLENDNFSSFQVIHKAVMNEAEKSMELAASQY